MRARSFSVLTLMPPYRIAQNTLRAKAALLHSMMANLKDGTVSPGPPVDLVSSANLREGNVSQEAAELIPLELSVRQGISLHSGAGAYVTPLATFKDFGVPVRPSSGLVLPYASHRRANVDHALRLIYGNSFRSRVTPRAMFQADTCRAGLHSVRYLESQQSTRLGSISGRLPEHNASVGYRHVSWDYRRAIRQRP
jgi:hypothetical protein